ncbi:MFS transporter [Aeromicrobium piscarium]|uniref:MFS transporter n=1 Tax=Aeromicrobium piscarium TaxID=2590901 RepID=A0A554SGX7_9ACTN|nr:MFS transporter [Aeromicrobium piscarium]TSD65599.1 MFS transporter [Aeromicrobium piscarium]
MTTPAIRPRWRESGHLPQAVGLFSVAFLVAFETFAVATALPVVAIELDGLSLFAVSFAAPAATAIGAMTCAAWWCDRYGHARPILMGMAVFGIGLVLSGAAPSMEWFVAGRAVQGLGAGLVSVALYVLVARAFPDHLRPRAFVVLTSAWVLPAVVGPLISGTIAEHLGWRWVFLGVPSVAIGALALLRPALRSSHGDATAPMPWARVLCSLAVAVAIFAVMIGGQRDVPGWRALVAVGVVLAVVAAVPLVPRGTVRAARGLPAVIATRSLMGTGLATAESFVPLALVRLRELTPTHAGLFLTSTALLWFAGAWASDRWLSPAPRIALGAVSVSAALCSTLLIPVPGVPVVALAIGWAFAGWGMGLAMPALSVLLLEHSVVGEEGRNSASMQTSDAVADALVLAVCSGLFGWLLAKGPATPFIAVFAVAVGIALLALPASRRVSAAEAR